MGDPSCVRVAVRVRPQSEREKVQNSRICTSVLSKDAQITIGTEQSFTYDYAFDIGAQQQFIYDTCIKNLIDGTFDGFNATVFAYGQTGSGKTYTMGTAFDMMDVMNENDIGIIPRAIEHLFAGMESRKQQAQDEGFVEPCFDIVAQFVELYNEEVIDLLSHERSRRALRIHEDSKGQIFLNGVTRITVTSPSQTLQVLKNGALNRRTAATNMNEQSSRSHAIFTMMIKQQRTVIIKPSPDSQANAQKDTDAAENEEPPATELELLSAKFHFVDLAGSERLKRSGASGERAREGININLGLLALGNVIYALTAPPQPDKTTHIPYRDSKLTRLLQDSLGGNSRTLMIACVSPSDCDYVETLNTLRYANRAKDIKNKVVANQDKSSQLMARLRSRIAELEAELLDYKQGRITVADGVESFNDQYRENVLLQADVDQLRIRVKALQETVEMLRSRNVQLLAQKNDAYARMNALQNRNSQALTGDTDNGPAVAAEHVDDPVSSSVRIYLDEMESLRCALMESQATNQQLHQQLNHWREIATNNAQRMPLSTLTNNSDIVNGPSPDIPTTPTTPTTPASCLIQEAKADIERMKQSITGSLPDDEKACGGTRRQLEGNMIVDDFETNGDLEGLKDYDDESFVVENEAETECFKLRDDLADLQAEISIKERLVLELEHSERRLEEVQIMYEKKLAELSARIHEIEAERDRVLAGEALKNSSKKVVAENVRKIREDYEKRLSALYDEYKKLKSVEQEHRRMRAKQAAEQLQLVRLRNELNDLKKNKVNLMQKIKEEVKRAKTIELENMKKVAGLEKESRKKDNIIQRLQNKDRQREEFLKRSADEVNRLRQQARERTANERKMERIGTAQQRKIRSTTLRNGRGTAPLTRIEENKAKSKWMAIEKNIRRRISQRQAIMKMEDELEKLVADKYLLTEEIQRFEQQFINAKILAERDLIGEHIDGCYAKMRYLQEQFNELHNTIAGIDNKNGEDSGVADAEATRDAETEIENCTSIGEAVIILKHLFAFSLEQGFIAAKAISDKKEAESRIQELQHESNLSDAILNQALENANEDDEEQERSRDASPEPKDDDAAVVSGEGYQVAVPAVTQIRDDVFGTPFSTPTHKIRRRTATPDELLYPAKIQQGQTLSRTNKAHSLENINEESEVSFWEQQFAEKNRSASYSAPESEKHSPERTEAKIETPKMTAGLDTDDRTSTPTSSRGDRRRSGRIVRYVPQTLPGVRDKTAGSRMLVHTLTLDGHARSVVSVDANDTLIITGSKDRTAKIWDLEASSEKCTLGLHPNNVFGVRFIPFSQMALTVSLASVRIWDLRTEQCVRTLHSSGLAAPGAILGPNIPRQTTLPVTETMINAVELDNTGKLLFTTFNSDVRIWNLEKFAPFGRLSAATHTSRSEVSCLGFLAGAKPKIFTGSRDHFVKMYEINESGMGLFEAAHEFSTAHYDCVTSVVPYKEWVFSASRDTNIMRFSLADMKRDHVEAQAHSKSIQAMCVMDSYRPVLVSACKEGSLKIWDIATSRRLRLIDHIPHAHEVGINDLATTPRFLFTASSDTTVAVWQINFD